MQFMIKLTALSTWNFCTASKGCRRYKSSTFAGLNLQRYKYSLHFCPGFGMLCCCHIWCLCVSSVLPVLLRKWNNMKLSSQCMAWLLYYTMLCLGSLSDCRWGNCKNTAVQYKQQAFSAALPIFLNCKMCPIYFGNNKAFLKADFESAHQTVNCAKHAFVGTVSHASTT